MCILKSHDWKMAVLLAEGSFPDFKWMEKREFNWFQMSVI